MTSTTTTDAHELLRTRATVTIPDAASILGIGRSCAYNAARRGELPTIVLGRRRLVSTKALLAMLEGAQ